MVEVYIVVSCFSEHFEVVALVSYDSSLINQFECFLEGIIVCHFSLSAVFGIPAESWCIDLDCLSCRELSLLDVFRSLDPSSPSELFFYTPG